MGSGYSKMKKQARLMEEQMGKMKEEMKNLQIEGSSGAGRVKVIMDGEKNLLKLTISPECVDVNDLEGLQDLILEACSEASKKVDQKLEQNKMPGLGSGLMGF